MDIGFDRLSISIFARNTPSSDVKQMGDRMNIIDFNELQAISEVMANDFPESVYRLRLDFRFDELVCIRDLAVGSDATLDDLHTMIQACGNWMNYHLYSFEFMLDDKLTVAEVPSEYGLGSFGMSRMPIVDSRAITIKDAMSSFPSMIYSYDYGDGWEIIVTCLGFIDPKTVKKLPCCLFGKGDWPPEDVGAEGGFIRFLETIKNPLSDEYEEMREWGEFQGYEKYSLQRCNANLAHWNDYRSIEL